MKKKAKKEFRIALDIGTRLIKALELLYDGEAKRLLKIQYTEITPPPTEENITSALKSLMESFRPSIRDVNISLSSPHAIVRFINMPRMKEEDMRNSLRFEAEKYIPFNMKEVVVDGVILGYTTEDKRQMRVVLAAVKRKALELRINILKNLGLSPSVIDIDGFACFNAFCNFSGSLDEARSIALLNIGYTHTNLIISQGANPFFSRDIQIGAKDIAKGISQRLSLEEGKSERLIFDPEGKSTELHESAKPILNSLIDELRLSFGYYENQHGKSINEIYISGGTARLEGISKYFEDNFGVKTMLWNPLSRFEIDPRLDVKFLEATYPQFAVSAGLAIR